MSEPRYEIHSDEKDYIYIAINEVANGEKIENYVEPHFHSAVELKIMVKGRYLSYVGGQKRILKEGEVLFVNPRQIHYGRCDISGSKYYTVVFDSSFLYNLCGKGRGFATLMPKHEHAFELLKEVFNLAQGEWRGMNKEQRKGFIYRILGILTQYYGSVEEQIDKAENIAINVMEYIQKNYFEDLTLENLSKKFGYTRNHFSYLFNKYVGMNFRDCVNRCRIIAAIKLKEQNKDMPLCRIAEKVGYKSLATFYRANQKYLIDNKL